MSSIPQPSDFKYLAIEGGGGKGLAYSGGIKVLEKVDLLPITKNFDDYEIASYNWRLI